jgi:hypothetical protein
MWPDITMGICGKKFKIFYHIDFKIIAFEERRKCFFGPCLVGSASFENCWCQKLELSEAELLEIHNVWHVK